MRATKIFVSFALLAFCCAVFLQQPSTAVGEQAADHDGDGKPDAPADGADAGHPEPEPAAEADGEPSHEPDAEGSAEKEPEGEPEPEADKSEASAESHDDNAASHVGAMAPVILSIPIFLSVFRF